MTVRALSVSIVVAAGTLTLGYALTPQPAWGAFFVALGLVWLFGAQRGWRWIGSLGPVVFVGEAAAGVWLGAAAGWMLVGAVAALSAWDLDHFARRLASVPRVEDAAGLERAHLRRLLVVDAVGVTLAGIPLVATLDLGFGAALLLGLLAIVGLSHTIGFLRRESD